MVYGFTEQKIHVGDIPYKCRYIYIYVHIRQRLLCYFSDSSSTKQFPFPKIQNLFFVFNKYMLFILPDCVCEMRDGSDLSGRRSFFNLFLYLGETQGIPTKCGWKGTAVDENL